MYKTTFHFLLTFVVLAAISTGGCKKKKEKVQLDPEIERELEEFSKAMASKSSTFDFPNRSTTVVPATSDTTERSPAAISETPEPAPNHDNDSAQRSNQTSTHSFRDQFPEADFDSDSERTSALKAPTFQPASSNSNDSPPSIQSSDEIQSEDVSNNRQAESPLDFTPETTRLASSRTVREPDDSHRNSTGNDSPNLGPTRHSLNRNSTPEEVCQTFLALLNDGDHNGANLILTNLAQVETARSSLQLESPGGPDTTFDILPAQYATSRQDVAQVMTLLRQPGHEPVRLTWMLRKQYNGWKIFGMSIRMNADSELDLLSFENPRDLKRIQASVDN